MWQADSRLVRDAVVPMAAFAAATDRIRIGSGVIDIWTRNAARLASTFSTLDDLAPGRIICGLGAWWDPLAAKVGIDRARPLRVMREVVTAVRGLLANETVTFDGHHVHLDGVELDYVYQERRAEGRADLHRRHRDADDGAGGRDRRRGRAQLPRRRRPTTPRRSRRWRGARPRPGARSTTSTARSSSCAASTATAQAALDGARLLVTQYLGQQPHIMKASGVPQELLDEIGEVLTWPATHDEVVAASKLVPDDVVQRCTASGEPDEVVAKVDEYVANGCTCPILYPLGPDVGLMLDTFAR